MEPVRNFNFLCEKPLYLYDKCLIFEKKIVKFNTGIK